VECVGQAVSSDSLAGAQGVFGLHLLSHPHEPHAEEMELNHSGWILFVLLKRVNHAETYSVIEKFICIAPTNSIELLSTSAAK